MVDDVQRFLEQLELRPPATASTIAMAEDQLGAKLPEQYVRFLEFTDGGEGFIGENAYAMLWGVEELGSMNQAYEVEKYLPGLLLFGSDGAGEAYGFDTRNPEWPIVQVPFVGMAWDVAWPMGTSFNEFLKRLSESE